MDIVHEVIDHLYFLQCRQLVVELEPDIPFDLVDHLIDRLKTKVRILKLCHKKSTVKKIFPTGSFPGIHIPCKDIELDLFDNILDSFLQIGFQGSFPPSFKRQNRLFAKFDEATSHCVEYLIVRILQQAHQCFKFFLAGIGHSLLVFQVLFRSNHPQRVCNPP